MKNKMKNKLVALALALVLALSALPLAAAVTGDRVHDDTDSLPMDELNRYSRMLERVSRQIGGDAVFYIAQGIGERDPFDFAEEFYIDACYAADGILLMIAAEDGYYIILPFGKCAEAFTDDGEAYFYDKCNGWFSGDGDLYAAVEKAFDLAVEFVSHARHYGPYDRYFLPESWVRSPHFVDRGYVLDAVSASVVAAVLNEADAIGNEGFVSLLADLENGLYGKTLEQAAAQFAADPAAEAGDNWICFVYDKVTDDNGVFANGDALQYITSDVQAFVQQSMRFFLDRDLREAGIGFVVGALYSLAANYAENETVPTADKLSQAVPKDLKIYPYGDVTGDGKVNSADGRQVLRFAARLDSPDELQQALADLDGNGKVNSADARAVLQAAAKLVELGDYYQLFF